MTKLEIWGATSPILNICNEFDIPPWVGYVIADLIVHNRDTYWTSAIVDWSNEDHKTRYGLIFVASMEIEDTLLEIWKEFPSDTQA